MTSNNNGIIKNEYEGIALTDAKRFELKYKRFIGGLKNNQTIEAVYEALKSHDIERAEMVLSETADNMRSSILIIGLACLVIEREGLYRVAGFRSYLEYSQRLFQKLEISPQTLSDSKIIMGAYIDHHQGLSKAGFKLERNAHKLRFIDEAIRNHGANDAYKNICEMSMREFVDYARLSKKELTSPAIPSINIKIDGNKIYIDGENILNIPETVPEKIREEITRDLSAAFTIRASGNEPFIVETYGKGEQTAINNFLKKFRAKK